MFICKSLIALTGLQLEFRCTKLQTPIDLNKRTPEYKIFLGTVEYCQPKHFHIILVLLSADLNAKNVQLPDLIKETSNLKDLELKLPSKPAIIEEKSSPSESLEPSKDPDITVLKIETPTPTSKAKSFNDPPTPTTKLNGDTFHHERLDSASPPREASKKELENEEQKEADDEEGSNSSDDSDEIESDSLSSSDELNRHTDFIVPKLQIHSTEGDLLLADQIGMGNIEDPGQTFEPDSIECSYLLQEQQQPAKVPDVKPPAPPQLEIVNSNLKQLHMQDELGRRNNFSGCSSPTASLGSSKNDDSEDNDPNTAALTETEFSEWARDGDDLVSEDLRDVEYDINPEGRRRPSNERHLARIANGEDLTDVELDYSLEELNNGQLPSTIASKLLANGEEDIGFMDTDNESLLEEDSLRETKPRNRGYVEFVSFKSPSSPQMQAPIARTDPEYDESSDALTPCCEDGPEQNVIEFDPVTIDDVRDRLRLNGKATNCEIRVTGCEREEQVGVEGVNKDMMSLSMEEDSLLIVEPHEDTTTSEVVTILASPVNPLSRPVVSDKGDDTPSEPTKTPELGELCSSLHVNISPLRKGYS